MKQTLRIILGIFSVALLVVVVTSEPPPAGGIGGAQKPDANVRHVVKKLTPNILKEICKKLGAAAAGKPRCKKPQGKLEPLEFKTQTVAGVNYFVKVRDDEKLIWHLKIFDQSWTSTLELLDLQGPKAEADAIEFF